MKKTVLLTLIAVAASYLSAAEAIVKNGSFKDIKAQNLPCWWGKAWPKNQGDAAVSKNTYKSAPASFVLQNSQKDQFTLYKQYITLKPDTDYIITLWMKGNSIQPKDKNGGARFYLFHKGKTFLNGSFKGKWKPATGTFGWQKATFEFYTKDIKSLCLLLGLYNASGTVWFDDVTVREFE